MVLHHINHKMPIYKDCTLGEMLAVGFANFMAMGFLLSSITYLIFGYALIGVVLALVSLLHTTRFWLGRLQELKYGKPHGYYRQLFQLKAARTNVLKIPLVRREGKWSIRRKGEPDVSSQ